MKRTDSLLSLACICLFLIPATAVLSPCAAQQKKSKNNWFPYFDFNAAQFRDAPREFGPFTRWWWPGNDVSNEELVREIKMFADNGFAGVEIQPLTMGINPAAADSVLDKVYSWDSPSFYAHVSAVMEQAKESGVIVDMNGGSGWPLGGPHVKPAESMRTLTYDDTIITGGTIASFMVPKQLPDYSQVVIFDTHLYSKLPDSLAILQAVIATRIIKKDGGQVFLDPASAILLAPDNKNIVHFTAPPGNDWMIIAYWCMPDGQVPTVIASRNPGLVANHFDSVQVIKSYEHLFGAATGLQRFYGNPFRAVFNDSYEFRSDRHYAENFISFFKEKRGYDITPWLGAVLQKGYNNNAGEFLYPGAKPPFVFSVEDERIRYDYDLTVGELLQQQFIQSSDHWMQSRNMLHRTQAYGIKTDVIAAAGNADIPEAEQLFAGGSEGFIKLITSGAHLYNRPVITQESFVFINRPEMVTPQKIKALSDKAFACGINQLIYSGTSYKYQNGDYGAEGWNTWSTPYSGFSFSSNENESFEYWKYIKDINKYISRCQYALRSGKSKASVVIYFPFIDFTQEDMLANPKEAFVNGYFEGVEPALGADTKKSHDALTARQRWLYNAWHTIQVLDENGITWEWVNDASLQTATYDNGSINIRGNVYDALLMINVPYVQLNTAKQIAVLAGSESRIAIVGSIPEAQPGFYNHVANDSITKFYLKAVQAGRNTLLVKDSTALYEWITCLPQPICFGISCTSTRCVDRVMNDGSVLRFISNQSGSSRPVRVKADNSFGHRYFIDPSTGKIVVAKDSVAVGTLAPFGSVIFYASKTAINPTMLSLPEMKNTVPICSIDKWNIRSGNAFVENSVLFDWRDNDVLKYRSEEGVYTAVFNIDVKKGKQYFLNAGMVYFTMEVTINGQYAGKRIWAPYMLDVTKLLKQGTNSVEIRVIPVKRNEYIHLASLGDPHYAQFKGMNGTLLPAGLVGPVQIMMAGR